MEHAPRQQAAPQNEDTGKMMIKCIECGHENQLGSIFCRECGAKLDVDKLRPEVSDKKISFNVLGFIRSFIALALLFGAIAILGAMFYPASVSPQPLTEKEQKAAEAKFKAMIAKIDDDIGEDAYTFTPAETTYLYNNILTEKSEDGDGPSYKVNNMVFETDPMSGTVRVAMLSSLYGISTSFELSGAISSENDKPEFTILGQKMGHLSIPKGLRNKIVEKFTPVLDDPRGAIRKVLDNAKSIAIEDGNLVIKVKSAGE